MNLSPIFCQFNKKDCGVNFVGVRNVSFSKKNCVRTKWMVPLLFCKINHYPKFFNVPFFIPLENSEFLGVIYGKITLTRNRY